MYKKITLIWVVLWMLALTSFAANRNFTLVIDAGHGGHDAGARGAISMERTSTCLWRYNSANMLRNICQR